MVSGMRWFGFVMVLVLFCTTFGVLASDNRRTYPASFFRQFAPQTALEMVVRVPGFVLNEADENRGLSQGGTNVLINRQPIIGKGEAATTQISQIPATSVSRIDVIDAGTLDLPGFSGLVANIVTEQRAIAGTMQWEPQWRDGHEPALLNGGVNVSGRRGALDFTGAATATMVRASFIGPETVSDAAGVVFETRDEQRYIEGNQQELAGSLHWDDGDQRAWNAKALLSRLDLDRPQISQTRALTSRGIDSLNVATFGLAEINARVDTDYRFEALGGSMKLIGLATRAINDGRTRVTVEQSSIGRIADRRFDDRSVQDEGVVRVEQNWERGNQSWQFAGEGVLNNFEVDTQFAIADPEDATVLLDRSSASTRIRERRAEVSLAHRRKLNATTDLQFSVGAETSTIEQGAVKRRFDRPKGFVSLNSNPTDRWTLTARAARDIGQINFRDFAASVSLIEEVITQNNPELVPQQSWLFSVRAERRFSAGHVASIELADERINDLVDRIPLGDDGDAIGNIPNANRQQVTAVLTLLGAPVGVPGAQLDLRGSWQRSSVNDPIEGFDRQIGRLRTRDLRAEFRHDILRTDLSYGFVFQDLALAPFYQSQLVQFQDIPSGGLTPGQNQVFVEHKDVFGMRVRATLSEFIGQTSRFSRVIHGGRRDLSPIDRVERRERDLGGPFFSLSFAGAF